jgi:ribokinase
VQQVPGVSSGVATILVEPSGENRILIVAGANAHLHPADIDAARDVIAEAGLILLQLEVPIETVYHAVALAHRLGRPVLLNPAPALPDLDLDRIRTVSFLVPNETELALLTGLPTRDVPEIEAAARVLIARGIGTVIVTMGAKGALLVTAEASRSFPRVAVTPIDTTGAGDAFIGAFAKVFAETGAVETSIAIAMRYAALSVTKPGAQAAFATDSEFRAFCAELGSE